MNDLISRSKLIEEILEEANTKILDLESGITLGEMKEWVENQPAVESPTWIPCSEKFPEIHGRTSDTVLVCTKKGNQYMAFWCEDEQWRFCECGTAKEPMTWAEIIAWMPLPEPYKGEQHETD